MDNEKEHCKRVSYILEKDAITTRCYGNCACCKDTRESKKGNQKNSKRIHPRKAYQNAVPIKPGDVPTLSVSGRKWNDDSIAATIELVLPPEVYKLLPTL